jgi:hypothetical protein
MVPTPGGITRLSGAWFFCNRGADLRYGGNGTAGVCPAGPGGRSVSPRTPLRLVDGWARAPVPEGAAQARGSDSLDGVCSARLALV